MRVSFWLLPVKDDQAPLQVMIDAFAREYDAPRFAPHVTLHASECGEATAAAAVEAAAELPMPPALDCRSLQATPDIAKTLFIPLDTCPELEALSANFRAAAPSDYLFAPHLSLLYKPLLEPERLDLLRRFDAPLQKLRFDRVCAIDTEGDLRVKSDVEDWRVLAEATLSPSVTEWEV